MCFEITSTKAPKKTVAYKVVTPKRKPPYYQDSRITYKVGSVVKIPTRSFVNDTIGEESHAGIYVYLHKKDAINELKYWNYAEQPPFQVIKVEVDPKDFIARGYNEHPRKKPVATYRKVKVLS